MDISDASRIGLIGFAASMVAFGTSIVAPAVADEAPWKPRIDEPTVVVDDDEDLDDDTDDTKATDDTDDAMATDDTVATDDAMATDDTKATKDTKATDDADDPTGKDTVGKIDDTTNSKRTPVSRDRDRSRGGLTRDWTRDGDGKLKRDWSDNHTDDNTGNDTRASKKSRDKTKSNFTPVSRDRDRSRGDLTKDMTMDGGELTRDLTRYHTDDNTKNDTR